ncbi:MAG: penicillin-binding protein 2 [Candidatus Accumulibacter sp.]|jgi:cell division protein FtsI (penicillin-binding protein 3)|nr:penicillin-binding protein 2 [Accumulibacter sp.]
MKSFKGSGAHKFTESPVLQLRLPAWRSRFMGILILSALVLLIGRSFYLQILRNDFLQGKGELRYKRELEISASRGRISDRNGEILAVSTPMASVWAIPAEARLSQNEIKRLAGLIELSARDLTLRLASEKSFVFLKRQLPPDIGEKVAALKLRGIGIDKEYRRYYPTGEMAAHVVGFTGVDDKGLEGVELAFDAQLSGKPGSRSVIRDRRGQIVEDAGSIHFPKDGKDTRLSLDMRVQYLAYSQLKQVIADTRAKAGSVVVVDARTGEIIALSNWPTYNPNNRELLSGTQLRNRAITDTYEPGSVIKPFTAALALENEKVRFDTPINCAPGKLTIGTATISDPRPHGTLSVAQVIQKSSNVGSAKIARMLSAKEMWGMLDSIGFGHVTHLGFPGEVSGRMRPWKSWLPIEQATISYGHGFSVSLVQLAKAYTVFARDGDLIPLSLIRLESPPLKTTQVFSPQTVREVRAMLEMAVQPGGTAPKVRIPGYRVAGKTGTAHKVEGGHYAKNKYVASFAGFAPASDPRFVVAVMIDEPEGNMHFGGSVAGPVFTRVMSGLLRLYSVPQDSPSPAEGMHVVQNSGHLSAVRDEERL